MMCRLTALVVLSCIAISVSGQKLENKLDSVSYSLGAMIVKNMKQQGIKNVNLNLVAKAIQDALEGRKSLLTENAAQSCLNAYIGEIQQQKMEENKIVGNEFLAMNKMRPEVKTTASGLQYEVMRSGTGISPTASDRVITHYHGTLIDGTVFDSSVERGEPLSFGVGQVIQGWQEALQLMKVGDKWKLYVPQELAYGARGAGKDIGPFSALIFEIELLGIEGQP